MRAVAPGCGLALRSDPVILGFMSAERKETGKPEATRLQFSLRTFLIVILVSGCLFGGVGRAYRQQRALARVRELGGVVYTCPDGNIVDRLIWNPPVLYVELRGPAITDAELRHLKNLPEFNHLYLRQTQVTDAGLSHIVALSHLEVLTLEGNRISARRIQELKELMPYCDVQYTR